jgi:hypothetical protein
MPTATERIPVLVTKLDKSRFAKKAKILGFRSIGDFARQAMTGFNPNAAEEEAAFDALLKNVKEGTRKAEQRIDQTLAACDASNQRMAELDAWMRQKGYA